MKKNLFIILSMFMALTILSCAREGCTDHDADNYDPAAKKNDYSCQYTGYHIIWYGYEVSNFFKSHNVTYLHITTSNGQRLTHRAADYAFGPNKYDSGCIVLKQTMGTKHMGTDYVIITTNLGDEVWSGYIEYGVGKPKSTELILR